MCDRLGCLLIEGRKPIDIAAWDLPKEGQRIDIHYPPLKGGTLTSRIIGYELKADIPIDTPIYIVGESEIKSRLKQIERKLKTL